MVFGSTDPIVAHPNPFFFRTLVVSQSQNRTGMKNEYFFVTEWRVQSTCEKVYRLLEKAEDLKRWWPSVYLDVKEIRKGMPGGVGKEVALYTKGWLPYTLKWQFVVTKAVFPNGFALKAQGDFEGNGEWFFTQEGTECLIRYEWRVRAEKPLLRFFSFLLKPVFSANHHWAMRMGYKSLLIELDRLKKSETGEGNYVPSPPGPVFPHNLTPNKIFSTP